MRTFSGADELAAAAGERLGESAWLPIEQERIDRFAEATGDHQWIHVDPERAKDGPFGTTIAHGYLTLALIPGLMREIVAIEGTKMAINYGVNKVRFVTPVPVGGRVRAVTEIADVERVGEAVQVTYRTSIELEGAAKPACVAEHIGRYSF